MARATIWQCLPAGATKLKASLIQETSTSYLSSGVPLHSCYKGNRAKEGRVPVSVVATDLVEPSLT